MKMKTLFLFFCVVLCSGITAGQTLKVMTYNIRLDLSSDSSNAWPNRKELVLDVIRFYEPAIFGVQEALPHQMQYLDSALPNFAFVGMGRDGGQQGEFSALFYNKNRFSVFEQATFWLSETPDVAGKGWDAAFPRICTHALFLDKETQQIFWVFNLHLDHVGEKARLKSVKLVQQRIAKLNNDGLPVILMGDFNASPDNEVIKWVSGFMKNTRDCSVFNYGTAATFNGFRFDEPPTQCIDYIFVSPGAFTVEKHAVINDSNGGRYPSDHFPVLVELRFN
ncbi:MAG: endonuclease/exonuclease/phosphatase [Bacteroidetes bacterium HGW-Bacteroidetes-4]|jgi:endonuclease/exonuclease/phosphatase family metal-dependent hydrolase|nr:MAG: endonuclease/exonuclease/phosphatase [Bacteroidetes bacterium HGW-Bacteroidetes-4]